MDATRTRLSFEQDHLAQHVQWIIATALLAVAVVVASLVVREVRFAPAALAGETESASATVMPRDAVSVPTLVLAAGGAVHVGEPRTDAVASLGSLTLLKRTEEQGPLGAREVRSYQGVTLVFEPFERAGDARVAAIYLQ
jgi:hypothetical protein